MKRTPRQGGFCSQYDLMVVIAVISILAAILIPNFLKVRRAAMDRAMKKEALDLAAEFDRIRGLAAGWSIAPAAPARASIGALPLWDNELIYEVRRGAGAYEGGGRTGAHRFEMEGLRLYNLQKDESQMGFHVNFYMPGKNETRYIGSVVLSARGEPVVLSRRGVEMQEASLPVSISFCNDRQKYTVTLREGKAAVDTK